MENIKKISFIGLGVMGFPMAGHLSKRPDVEITVFNRTPAKSAAWAQTYSGKTAETPEDAVSEADLILICVGRDEDLRQMMEGIGGDTGILSAAKAGAIIIDHTTVSAKISREMAEKSAARGVFFMDAPVSGGQAGAENGALTVMCGGDLDAFERVKPLLKEAYAKEMRLMGPVGAGQLTKMVNQICIAGLLQGLSEGVAFGLNAGLDMDEVFAAIGKGAAQSWQMDNRGRTMARDEFDFGFALDWMIKDLKIAIDEASRNKTDLPVTQTVLSYYEELSEKGCGRMDTSALVKRLHNNKSE